MRFIVLLSFAVLLSGCGALLPSRKSESAAVKAAESVSTTQNETVRHIVKAPAQKAPEQTEIKIGGLGNKVDVRFPEPPPQERQIACEPAQYQSDTTYSIQRTGKAGIKEDLKGNFDVSIPMGVNLLLLAGGVIAIVIAIKIAKNSSASTKAAFDMADSVIAHRIRAFRERVAQSTDASELARLNAEIASLEADRGRLKSGAV